MMELQSRLGAFAVLGEAILQPAFRFPKPCRNRGHVKIVHCAPHGVHDRDRRGDAQSSTIVAVGQPHLFEYVVNFTLEVAIDCSAVANGCRRPRRQNRFDYCSRA